MARVAHFAANVNSTTSSCVRQRRLRSSAPLLPLRCGTRRSQIRPENRCARSSGRIDPQALLFERGTEREIDLIGSAGRLPSRLAHRAAPYLLHLKKEQLGYLHCEKCGAVRQFYEVHHARSGLDVTFKDLILLCLRCHHTTTREDA